MIVDGRCHARMGVADLFHPTDVKRPAAVQPRSAPAPLRSPTIVTSLERFSVAFGRA
jgi:hypothetical protein